MVPPNGVLLVGKTNAVGIGKHTLIPKGGVLPGRVDAVDISNTLNQHGGVPLSYG